MIRFPFTFNLDIILDSAFFFSRLAKYLLFLSFCSIICALDRIMSPFSLLSVIFSNSFFLLSSSCLSLSLCCCSCGCVNSFSNLSISLI